VCEFLIQRFKWEIKIMNAGLKIKEFVLYRFMNGDRNEEKLEESL
jgi:hypothetical protein